MEAAADRVGNTRIGHYERLRFLGEGGFAKVFAYKRKKDGLLVAIKEVRRMKKEDGVNLGAVKEIQVLLELSHPHPNVIRLYEVFPLRGMVHMVLEMAATDLARVIKDRSVFLSVADVKAFLKMLLEGLAYLHGHWIMHRDLKPENLFIAADGVLKIGDFGHATTLSTDNRTYHHTVVTLWYRPPELLFKAPFHTEAVDMWSVGCIFAEMLLRRELFPGGGTDEESARLNQVAQIVRILGTPDPLRWKGVRDFDGYVEFAYKVPEKMDAVFPELDPTGLDLMSQMLQYDPAIRISAAEALKHPFFSASPAPTPHDRIPLGLRPSDDGGEGAGGGAGAGDGPR